jgi:hypothetical protein
MLSPPTLSLNFYSSRILIVDPEVSLGIPLRIVSNSFIGTNYQNGIVTIRMLRRCCKFRNHLIYLETRYCRKKPLPLKRSIRGVIGFQVFGIWGPSRGSSTIHLTEGAKTFRKLAGRTACFRTPYKKSQHIRKVGTFSYMNTVEKPEENNCHKQVV